MQGDDDGWTKRGRHRFLYRRRVASSPAAEFELYKRNKSLFFHAMFMRLLFVPFSLCVRTFIRLSIRAAPIYIRCVSLIF